MTTSRDRVLAMMQRGQVTPEQGAELLTALEEKGRLRGWLLDPCERLSTARALTIGAIVSAASGLAALSLGVRFDGALDLHLTSGAVTWQQALADQLVSWPLSALAIFAVARAFRAPARLLDVAAFLGVVRAIYLPLALLTWALFPRLPAGVDPAALTGDPALMARLTLGAILSLPVLGYFGVLLFRAYRTATDLRAPRLGVSFALALIAAEGASKGALFLAERFLM